MAVGLYLFASGVQAKRVSVDPAESERKIGAILYSNLSKEAMLVALKPYVSVGDTLKRFKKRTGLDPGVCIGSGPGVMHCGFGVSHGLEFVVDPKDRIQLIRRAQKVLDGVEYPEMSITASCMEHKGYTRCYED